MSETETKNSTGTNEKPKFTIIQRKILKLLADGQRHSSKELKLVILDEHTSTMDVRNHLSRMRKVLRPLGYEILCELWERKLFYRFVAIVSEKDVELIERSKIVVVNGRGSILDRILGQ